MHSEVWHTAHNCTVTTGAGTGIADTSVTDIRQKESDARFTDNARETLIKWVTARLMQSDLWCRYKFRHLFRCRNNLAFGGQIIRRRKCQKPEQKSHEILTHSFFRKKLLKPQTVGFKYTVMCRLLGVIIRVWYCLKFTVFELAVVPLRVFVTTFHCVNWNIKWLSRFITAFLFLTP